MNQGSFSSRQAKRPRVLANALFFILVGATILAGEIYAAFHYEDIRKSLKPTFTIGTPRAVATIYTPWGRDEQNPLQTASISTRQESSTANINTRPIAQETVEKISNGVIQKCETNGKITYQDKSCDDGIATH
jgi:hypothetical protein